MVVEGNQLLDTATAASLAILLSNSRITQLHKISGPEAMVMVTKAMVVLMVVVKGRPVVRPMLWMPMSSRGICKD